MNCREYNLNLIISLANTFFPNNPCVKLTWLLLRYARRKLDELLKTESSMHFLPDQILEKIIEDRRATSFEDCYPGYECCILGKPRISTMTKSEGWHYICSKTTYKKYKVFVVASDECQNGEFIVSETTNRNIINVLGHALDEQSFFVMTAEREAIPIAMKAKVSMITNTGSCPNDFVECLLQTFFQLPRCVRSGDIIAIDTKTYAPDHFYALTNNCPRKVHFRVDSVSVRSGNFVRSTKQACYVIKGETSLVQSSNIFGYVPPEFLEYPKMDLRLPLKVQMEMSLLPNCPPSLEKSFLTLSNCVSPFLQKGIKIKIRPVFLVKGAPGSGKFKLIECLAKRKGVNLSNVDFSEIQCVSAAQTEAKVRIVLQNVRACVPCILRLSNVQIFGKNAEGKKDERIISSFASELEKLNDEDSEFPVIVIATLENDELEAEMNRLFIETICIEHPNKSERADTLSWLLKTRGLSYTANLMTVAGLVSDFVLADLEALVLQTAGIAYKSSSAAKDNVPLTLTEDDFSQACESMQSSFIDRVGAPRIPKVNWEDIGGLASLKHEIKRRIELPMLNTLGLGRSGLLLHGPPGTGKTLLAKAVATECQLHFMSVKGPELLNMYVGQSEKNIRQVFERARAAAPCVIFFDELDSLAPNRGRSGDSGGVMDRVVSQLLAEMDGLESTGNIFVIGATNRLDLIDPALLRPGRFDKMLYVGIYGDRESQLSVLRAVTRRFRLQNNGHELLEIVDELPKNLTGADLYAICSDAWLHAVRRHFEDPANSSDATAREKFLVGSLESGIIVELDDFREAVKNFAPSLTPAELSRYEKLAMEFPSTR